MRWLVCVAFVTGCDLVFPLNGTGGDGPLGPSEAAERCLDSTAFAAPATLGDQSTATAENDHECESCIPNSKLDGPDLVYQVQVPANQRLIARVTPLDAYDPSLVITNTCTNRLLVDFRDAVDAGREGEAETIAINNPTDAPASAFVIVDGPAGESGRFEIDLQTTEIPPGDTCNNALDALSGSTVGLTNDYSDCSTGEGQGAGPDAVVAFDFPAGSITTLNITTLEHDALIYLIRSEDMCDPRPPCLVRQNAVATTPVETLTFMNTGEAFTGLLVIDGVDRDQSGPFSIIPSGGTTVAP